MFRDDLKNKYPFLTDYFTQGLKNYTDKNVSQKNNIRKLSHSILFYGQDIQAQYDLATEIARILNCDELKNNNCHCLNCNWVKDKKHPAVLTISKLDNKPSDDDSKTVISIAQARMIKISLMNTSDYHRVFIFCDAKMEGETWIPLGLNEINFQEETANSLLKIIEEPPKNTTFFFLTRDKNDLIETIISRSQSFFVPSYKSDENNYSIIETFFTDYPDIERKRCLDLAQQLFLSSKEHGCDKILCEIQNFFAALLKSNLENSRLKHKILSDIKTVELAKKMIKNHINPQLALEDMCLNLTKGY